MEPEHKANTERGEAEMGDLFESLNPAAPGNPALRFFHSWEPMNPSFGLKHFELLFLNKSRSHKILEAVNTSFKGRAYNPSIVLSLFRARGAI